MDKKNNQKVRGSSAGRRGQNVTRPVQNTINAMALSENHARANKNRKGGATGEHDETIEEALIDLYLSVKIRSNEEVSFSFF